MNLLIAVDQLIIFRAMNPVYSITSLLNNYRPSFTSQRLNNRKRDSFEVKELSTEDITRIAAACFVGSSINTKGLPCEHIQKIDLSCLLLAAAENISYQQYDVGSNLLARCFRLSSSTGSPIQRVVHYFSAALQEKIERKTGQTRKMGILGQDAMNAPRTNHPTQLVTQKKLPVQQIVHFIAVQTIIDHVASAKRVHIVDISIKHGIQWTALMQALVVRKAHLKISAVGTSPVAVAKTGKMLASFAETLGLPFNFKAVIVADIRDLKADMFEQDEGETLSVYSSMDMSTMIVRPDGLENLLKVLRKLKPCVMIVADVEAELNSLSFTMRFTEALFYYGVVFDYLHAFMDEHDQTRMTIESELLSQAIRSIIATEGRERVVRYVGISVWRSFFARFGLVEAELNEWSPYQAHLIVEQFEGGDSCNVEKNGKSLVVGWKGSPLLFVSAWKFEKV